MSSISIPFPANPSKPRGPPPRLTQPKKRQSTQDPPPKPYLKRNSRWGAVLGKMTRPGEPMPEATQKHTKRAVMERAMEGSERDDESEGLGQTMGKGFHAASSSENKDFDVQVFAKPRPESLSNPSSPLHAQLAESPASPSEHQSHARAAPRHNQQHSHRDFRSQHNPNAASSDLSDLASSASLSSRSLSSTHSSPHHFTATSLQDSIKREDTFYTNQDNIAQLHQRKLQEEEDFKTHDARHTKRAPQLDSDDETSEVSASDDMFSPHDTHDAHNYDDDDVNLSSSNEKFNRTQRISADMFRETSRNKKRQSKGPQQHHKKGRETQQSTNATPLDSSAFNYEPTPITLSSDDKFTYSSGSNNPFDDANLPPMGMGTTPGVQAQNPFVEEPDLNERSQHSDTSFEQPNMVASPVPVQVRHAAPKSNRILDIHSSTDSWGPLEPTDHEDKYFGKNGGFGGLQTLTTASRSVPKPQNPPQRPQPQHDISAESPAPPEHDDDDIDAPVTEEEDDTEAPVSNLVNQYFYTEQNKQKKKKKQQAKVSKKKIEEDTQRELQELREQMEFFKTENEKLRKSRDALLNEKQKFANEKIQFQKDIERQQQELEEWREEELKKIRKERRVLERQVRANSQHMSRREQEKEIKSLREELNNVARQNKQHTAKMKAEIDRLREKLQSAEEERDAFRESVRKMEMAKIDRQFEEKRKPKVAMEVVEPQRGNYVDDEGYGARAQHQQQHVASSAVPSRVHKSPAPTRNRRSHAAQQHQAHFDDVSAVAGAHQHDTSSGSLPHTAPTQPTEEQREYRAYVQKLRQQFVVNDEELPPEDIPAIGAEPITINRLKGGKTENIYRANTREIIYQNGTIIRMFPSGYQKVIFTNGDVKETYPSGKVVYYYYTADTTHTEYPNRMQVFQFPNGQVERHYPDPDGTKEIQFPDKSIKFMHARFGSMYE